MGTTFISQAFDMVWPTFLWLFSVVLGIVRVCFFFLCVWFVFVFAILKTRSIRFTVCTRPSYLDHMTRASFMGITLVFLTCNHVLDISGETTLHGNHHQKVTEPTFFWIVSLIHYYSILQYVANFETYYCQTNHNMDHQSGNTWTEDHCDHLPTGCWVREYGRGLHVFPLWGGRLTAHLGDVRIQKKCKEVCSKESWELQYQTISRIGAFLRYSGTIKNLLGVYDSLKNSENMFKPPSIRVCSAWLL